MERYSVSRTVGKGSYGEVQLVKDRKELRQYVVKKLNLRNVSSRERRAAEQEAQLLSRLRHPNIVTYRESWEGVDGHLYIVMGYCEGGDLYHRLKEQKGNLLPESQVVEWFVQIAMALQYLHEKHILHRDLKTQNIFLTKSNIIKVGDLGIARVLESHHDMASTLIGTPYYMSPELFCNRPYNYKSDVWALGCCVFEMTTLKHAFNAKDMNSLVFKIIEGKLPPVPEPYSRQLSLLIMSMLSRRPEERPEVKAILRKPYIKSHIAVFLENTKVKAMKTRKRNVPEATPPSCSAVSPRNQPGPSLGAPQHDYNPSRKFGKGGESEAEEYGDHRCAGRPVSQCSAPNSNLSSTDTLATLSKVDISVVSGQQRGSGNPGHITVAEPRIRSIDCPITEPTAAGVPLEADPADKPKCRVAGAYDEKEATMSLLQAVCEAGRSLAEQMSFDSTEKLLRPFVPVEVSENCSGMMAAVPKDRDHVPHQPQKSCSEPVNSHQYQHREQSEEERPLSARERRRLKQYREELPQPVSTSHRSFHNAAGHTNSNEENEGVKPSSLSSAFPFPQEKNLNDSSPLSDDECSSTSSTDRSEGDSREMKQDSSEIHDLVQLMTQTLSLDVKASERENVLPVPGPVPAARCRYRDTLILHGKMKDEPEDVYFKDFPTESLTVPEKIKRTIQALRTDVVKGLGVKLLEKVYSIMEDDDEVRREECLQLHLGTDLYQSYSLKVRQLKFFEDNSNF
ncbi:serine/threonine-protein kinase Nek4 isoform X2 [Callorhinchus milii]|uniref:serine/threonine-protein kinase Nek4 isoform X2 n=1 Tax=Callorhinchus milii TaxID=7868 RepID=UPI001C3FC5D5|nr:serine/threonine-protein kinase Nek4 isoform X2 [Callorhinchus milii]